MSLYAIILAWIGDWDSFDLFLSVFSFFCPWAPKRRGAQETKKGTKKGWSTRKWQLGLRLPAQSFPCDHLFVLYPLSFSLAPKEGMGALKKRERDKETKEERWDEKRIWATFLCRSISFSFSLSSLLSVLFFSIPPIVNKRVRRNKEKKTDNRMIIYKRFLYSCFVA